LMHKEEPGHLDIGISKEGNHLIIKITDDGIGRKHASILTNNSATRHKSVGLKITEQRIAMLQRSNEKRPLININDLVKPDGSAAGTEVIIEFPIAYD